MQPDAARSFHVVKVNGFESGFWLDYPDAYWS